MKETGRVQRLGELLLACELITQQQLTEACRIQAQSGEKLGSTLVLLNHLALETLLKALGQQYGMQPVNLFKIDIPAAVLRLLPRETMKKFLAVPLTENGQMAMADPRDHDALRQLQFSLGRSLKPMVAPAFQIEAVLRYLEQHPDGDEPLLGSELVQWCSEIPRKSQGTPEIEQLFRFLLEGGGTDLLLVAGVPPTIKVNNELVRMAAPALLPEQVHAYAMALMTAVQQEQFAANRELDFAITLPALGRFRLNVYSQRNTLSLAARHIVEEVPTLVDLGLPSWLEECALRSQGLILITGPTGHGKTTTMAALIDVINTRCRRNIITLEDPVEYLHRHKSSNVNQREIGVDTASFPEGLRNIFREAPDVIVIGEMRDPESFAIALQAADTGHLVISCLHANNAPMAIDRIIDMVPPEQQRQVRNQLAENLLVIFNQRLVPNRTGTKRILAHEKLSNSYRVKALIRDGKEHQIRALLQQSADEFRSLDTSLAQLVNEGKVSPETALQFCQDASFFRLLLDRGSRPARVSRG
ncbi:MAG: PilT/PilU family type 4a pilus ATPase [Desulfuromonadales bacterium]|nr:PilT/PilU family type 4a pilus ATPase [Desulfuromonadales bacterium]